MLCSVLEHSMTPFRFQTAQKNSASLRSSLIMYDKPERDNCIIIYQNTKISRKKAI